MLGGSCTQKPGPSPLMLLALTNAALEEMHEDRTADYLTAKRPQQLKQESSHDIKNYELLQNMLRHNKPGERVYRPCHRQVEGFHKACPAVSHALSDNDP